MAANHDVLIIGAGHNGLVAGFYLGLSGSALGTMIRVIHLEISSTERRKRRGKSIRLIFDLRVTESCAEERGRGPISV